MAEQLSCKVDAGVDEVVEVRLGVEAPIRAAYQILPSTSHVFPPRAMATR